MLTLEQIAKMRARAMVATEGPLYVCNADDRDFMNCYYVSTSPDDPDLIPGEVDDGEIVAITLLQSPRLAGVGDGKWAENANLFAHARRDILALCDAMEEAMRKMEVSHA